jgi:hypothetical protein
MNKRLLILGGVILAVSAIAIAMLLFMTPPSSPDPEPTGDVRGGTVTLPDGSVVPADDSEAVNEPEPDGERNPDGTLKVEDPHFGDDGVHAEDVVECGEGPYSLPCDGEEFYEMPTAEAMDKASTASKAFAAAWLVIAPSEAAEARQARLTAAGAAPTVAAQVPALTRPNTSLTGLTTSSTPYGNMYAAFTRVQNGDIVMVVSVTATVKYDLNGVQNQTWTMPGTILVSINPSSGQVTNIVENYPELAEMS